MNENDINNDEIEINLAELFQYLKTKYKIILLSVIVCTAIAGLITTFLIPEKYESTARLLLKPETVESGYDYTQINANKAMVNNYIELLKGSNIQKQVATKLNLDVKEVKGSVSVTNTTDTQVIAITANTIDPKLSKDIVDNMVEVFTAEVSEKLDVKNIIIADDAEIAEAPVSPSLKKNLVIGAFLGIMLSVGMLFIRFMSDTHIHNKDEAEKYLGIPSLGVIPDFED